MPVIFSEWPKIVNGKWFRCEEHFLRHNPPVAELVIDNTVDDTADEKAHMLSELKKSGEKVDGRTSFAKLKALFDGKVSDQEEESHGNSREDS